MNSELDEIGWKVNEEVEPSLPQFHRANGKDMDVSPRTCAPKATFLRVGQIRGIGSLHLSFYTFGMKPSRFARGGHQTKVLGAEPRFKKVRFDPVDTFMEQLA